MNIKLFSLSKGDASNFAECKKMISDCANVFTTENEKFSNFASPKRLFLAVAQSLRSADCVIIGVQYQSYNSIKKMLCSALNLKLEQKEEVYISLLPSFEKGKITSTALENNSLFPVKSHIFPTDDYLQCGYCVTSGSQSIVVLPLDRVKTANVVFGSLYKFLGEQAGVDDAFDTTKIARLRLIERLEILLKKTKSTMAITKLNGVKLIEDGVNYVAKTSNSFKFGNEVESRNQNQTVKEYIVSAVQKTRIHEKTDYSLAISSTFEDNSGNIFILFAVGNKNETVVTKLFANDGESARDLTYIGIQKALESAGNCVAIKDENLSSPSAKKKAQLQKKLLTACGVAVGASAVIGTVLALLGS